MFRLAVATALTLAVPASGCTHSQLQKTGSAMIVVEQAAGGAVDGVDEYKAWAIEACRSKELPGPEERAKCIAPADKAVKTALAATQALKTALVAFWITYAVLEAKAEGGGKVTFADLSDLAGKADAVRDELTKLVALAKEAHAAIKN